MFGLGAIIRYRVTADAVGACGDRTPRCAGRRCEERWQLVQSALPSAPYTHRKALGSPSYGAISTAVSGPTTKVPGALLAVVSFGTGHWQVPHCTDDLWRIDVR
jgi:hypothetical protein